QPPGGTSERHAPGCANRPDASLPRRADRYRAADAPTARHATSTGTSSVSSHRHPRTRGRAATATSAPRQPALGVSIVVRVQREADRWPVVPRRATARTDEEQVAQGGGGPSAGATSDEPGWSSHREGSRRAQRTATPEVGRTGPAT